MIIQRENWYLVIGVQFIPKKLKQFFIIFLQQNREVNRKSVIAILLYVP